MVLAKPKEFSQMDWIRRQAAEFRKHAEETTLKGILSTHFQVSPDKPFTLDTAQARAFGFDIPDAWNIRAVQEITDEGVSINFRQLNPEGWEILGEDAFLSPTGEQFTLEDLEALEDADKLATGLFRSAETEVAEAPTIVEIEDPRIALLEPFIVEDETGEGIPQYDVRAAIIAGVDEQLLVEAFSQETVDAARIEPAGYIWDYTAGEFILADEEMLKQREALNAQFPDLKLMSPEQFEEWVANQETLFAEQQAVRARMTSGFQEIFPSLYQDLPEDEADNITLSFYNAIATDTAVQDFFIAEIRNIGRTVATENILEAMLPDATPQDISDIFGEQRIVPTLGEDVIGPELEPEWMNVITREVINQTEMGKRFPEGRGAGVDQWVLTPETGRNYLNVFKIFGEGLTKLPKQLASSILQSVQGFMGASVVDPDWADEIITEAQTDLDQFAQSTMEKYGGLRLPISVQDLATLPQNLAFSLTSMGAGIGVGAPIALTPIPGSRVAAWSAGTAASGFVAFQMASYQIMQTYLEVKNEEMKATAGRELTIDEENKLKDSFSQKAIQYGLWEAVPEALSNLAFARLLTLPLGRMVGKNIATQVISKVAGLYGGELLTETITQMGQADIEVGAGLRDESISWVQAFKEIAPQTFLLTTVMAGAGQVGVSSVNKIRQSLKTETEGKPGAEDVLENIDENIFNEVEAYAAEQEVTPEGAIALTEEGVTPTDVQLVEKPSDIGKAFDLVVDDKVVGSVEYGRAEGIGGEGIIIADIEVSPEMRREGIAAQVLDKILAEAQGENVYTGVLKPDGAAWLQGLEEKGIITLTDAPQKGLGSIISKSEVPVTEPGQPEAGLQPSMLPGEVSAKEVRPKGKGRVTQISMDDQLKLEEARALEPTEVERAAIEADEAAIVVEEQTALLKENKVENYRVNFGMKKQGKGEKTKMVPDMRSLMSFISKDKEGQFPETFTVAQAQALNPRGNFAKYLADKKAKNYNKVPADKALDWIIGELGMENTEALAAEVERIHSLKQELVELKKVQPVVEPTAEEVPVEAVAPVAEEVTAPVVEVTPEDVEVIRQLEELTKMHDIWTAKIKTMRQVKVDLAKFVRKYLPMNIRGKYITAVAKVETDAQLQEQLDRVRIVAEKNAQKVLTTAIEKKLAKAKPYIESQIQKGRFTPETQVYLDTLVFNLHKNRDEARAEMVANRHAYDEGTITLETLQKRNEPLNFVGIEGMTAEELVETLDYIDTLMLIGKSEHKAKQDAYQERMDAIRTEVGADGVIGGGRGLAEGAEAVPAAEFESAKSWFDKFVNWQYSWDNLLDKLSKFDKSSLPYQSALNKFGSAVHRATQRQVIGTKDAFTAVKKAVSEAFHVKGNRALGRVLNSLDEEVNLGSFTYSDEFMEAHPNLKTSTFTLKMTRNQMIAKYMQMQDPTLDNTFLEMGWSQDARDAVENAMTSEEIDLADSFFKFYEDYYQTVNPIYRELYNIDMPFNPRYSPIRREADANIPEDILLFQDALNYASALNGSIKSRVPNTKGLRFDSATDILSNHITQMEHFKAWALTMRDMRQVFANQEIRTAIKQYHGAGILKVVDKFLNDMARGGIETAATFRAADYLRRAFTKSILAIKPIILMKQVPSMFAYISEMPVTSFMGGVTNYWAHPIDNFKFLYANSEGFRARVSTGFERDIRAALEKHGKKQLIGGGSFTDWFLLQIRLGDAFAVTQGMWATYQYAMKSKADGGLGLSSEEALAHAEDVTGRTQPSFGIDTLSAFQSGSSFHKLLTMFMNQPNKYFRLVGDNLRNFRYGRGSRAKAASTIVFTWTVLPMLFQFIADAFQWKPERQLRAGLLGQLNHIFVAGQALQILTGVMTKEPFDYQVSPVLQSFEDVVNALRKAVKMVDIGQDPYTDISVDDAIALIEYLAKAAGEFTGTPTPYFVQLEKQLRHRFEAGEDIEVKHFLFSEWALEPPRKGSEQKVDDATLELGEVREGQEDAPLTEKDLKITTTVDWLRDIGEIYSKVLPQDVLDDERSSPESRLWAAAEMAFSKADILPNVKLYQINTDDDADTILNYYIQWKGRERQETLQQLEDYDERYEQAYLGNVTRRQYDVLKKYLDAEDKEQFLEDHKDELSVNPRTEYLKANPTDNALLAMKGEAPLLTMEAYTEFNRLVAELDIPEDAIPDRVLPLNETQAQSHFDYLDAVAEFRADSAEADLVLANDHIYADWAGLDIPEQPIRYYELKAANRAAREYWGKLSDKDDELYIEDIKERREALLTKNSLFSSYFDDDARTQAIAKEFPDDQIESWVEHESLSRDFGGNSAHIKVWAFENQEAYKTALDAELINDKGALPTAEERGLYEPWSFEAEKLRVTYTDEEDFYNTLSSKADFPETYIDDIEERWVAFDKEYPDNNYRIDLAKIEAHGKFFPEADVNLWAEREQIAIDSGSGSAEVKVFYFDNPELHALAKEAGLVESTMTDWNEPVLRIDVTWRDKDAEYDAIDPDTKNEATGVLHRTEWLQQPENDEYRKDRRRREAHQLNNSRTGYDFPDAETENFVAYNELPISGKRRDRFMVDNPEFAQALSNAGQVAEIPLAKDVPAVQFDDIYDKFPEQFDILNGAGNPESIHFIEAGDENPRTGRTPREQVVYDLRFDKDGKLTDFGKAEIRRNGYEQLVPDNYIERWTDWGILNSEGRPDDWPETRTGTHTWYEDDWYLIDHPSYYKTIYVGQMGLNDYLNEKDENGIAYKEKVPTREVFALYVQYEKLPEGKPREDLRWEHPELEAWGQRKFGWKSITEKRRRAQLSQSERVEEELRRLEEILK